MLIKKPAATPASANNNRIQFIDGIATSRTTRNNTSHYNSKDVSISKNITRGSANLENAQSWQFKYAQLLDVPVEEVLNQKLYGFIDEWYGTPYRSGGKTRDGIDCSGFVNTLMNTVFQLGLSGNSTDLLFTGEAIKTRMTCMKATRYFSGSIINVFLM